jgi:hypothetical protein
MSGLLLLAHQPAHAGEEVDLALVLAVDVSESMDTEEQELQRQGFIEAFRSPLVHDAIRDGMLGRVAVTYMEWARWTSISGAIDFSLDLLTKSNVEAVRQVIDISGDGANNQGRIVTEARDQAVARGVTINGLPIMLKRPRSIWDTEHLDLYYRECVIGGPGAFMVPVRERHQFAEAIRTKLIREIAGLTTEPLVQHVQSEPQVNCSFSRTWDSWRN